MTQLKKDLRDGISLCMIVKDEEESITRALESVFGLVDEIIVVDTGSSDRTIEYAEKLCAHVYSYQWDDNFSHARNFSLEKATCEWILVLDADEILSRKDFSQIKNIIQEGTADAVVLWQRNYCESPDAEGWQANRGDYEEGQGFSGYFDIPVIRLFRNDDTIRFKGVVHEIVDESLKDRKKRYLEVPIHHYTYFDAPEERDRKKFFYLDLLLRQLEIDPDDETTWFLIGRQYYSLGKYAEALVFLRRVIEMGSRCEMAYDNLANVYINTGMFPEAKETLETLVKLNPRYAEALSSLGVVYYELGLRTEAIETLNRAAMELPRAFRPSFNLAAIYFREKKFQEALSAIKNAECVIPHFPRIYYLKFYILCELEMWQAAQLCAEKLRMLDPSLYQNIAEKHHAIVSHSMPEKEIQRS
jgi:glycosyltransferase involved in cell wall biosynthesis